MATQAQIRAVGLLQVANNRQDILSEYSDGNGGTTYDISNGGSYRDAENGNVKVGGDPYEAFHAINIFEGLIVVSGDTTPSVGNIDGAGSQYSVTVDVQDGSTDVTWTIENLVTTSASYDLDTNGLLTSSLAELNDTMDIVATSVSDNTIIGRLSIETD